MAKLKKETVDELDLEILAILYYKGEATATDLEKELVGKITKAGISKRLKWLAEKGHLEEPEIDISTGKLKKIYKAPSKEKLKSIILTHYKKEYEKLIHAFAEQSGQSYEEIAKEYPLETAFKDEIIYNKLDRLTFEELKVLKEGVTLEEAISILEHYNLYPYYVLLSCEILDLVTVDREKKLVRITEKGLKAILEEWITYIKRLLKGLKELYSKAYKELLAEFCKDL